MNLILTKIQAEALYAAALAGAMEYRRAVENNPGRTEQAKGLNLAAFDRVMDKLSGLVNGLPPLDGTPRKAADK